MGKLTNDQIKGAMLGESLSEEDMLKTKEEWNCIGGFKVIPWWKWCLEHIEVKLK